MGFGVWALGLRVESLGLPVPLKHIGLRIEIDGVDIEICTDIQG